MSKWDGNAQVTGVLGHQSVRREVSSEAKPWAAASIEAGRWGGRVAYERVVLMDERAYGTGKWGAGGAYGRGSKRAWRRACEGRSNVWKRGSLAGHTEGCPRRNQGCEESYGRSYGASSSPSYGPSDGPSYGMRGSGVPSGVRTRRRARGDAGSRRTPSLWSPWSDAPRVARR